MSNVQSLMPPILHAPLVSDAAPDWSSVAAPNTPVLPSSSAGRQSDFTSALAALSTPDVLQKLHAYSGSEGGITAAAFGQLARDPATDAETASAAMTVTAPQNADRLNAVCGGRRGADGAWVFLDDDFSNYINGNGQQHPNMNGLPSYAQGSAGDCWVLSAIGAELNQPQYRDALRSAVDVKNTGTYRVRFPGEADTAYTVTPDEIAAAQGDAAGSSSTDSATVAALEIALKKRWQEVHGRDIGAGGGLDDMTEVLSLLSGRQAQAVTSTQAVQAAQAGAAVEFGSGVDEHGNAVSFNDPQSKGGHAFFVRQVEGERVHYVNRCGRAKTRDCENRQRHVLKYLECGSAAKPCLQPSAVEITDRRSALFRRHAHDQSVQLRRDFDLTGQPAGRTHVEREVEHVFFVLVSRR